MNKATYKLLEGVDLLSARTYQPTQHDTNELTHVAAKGLMVFAAGTVKFTTVDGVVDTWTIPSGALPFHIPVAISIIWDTGTSVADSDLRVLA